MDTKVAIHQPNYLPWPGYFYKLWLSDKFVFLDHVKLNKQGITRRTYVPKSSEPPVKSYLTIPLLKHSDYTLIKDLKIDHSKYWAQQHLNIFYQLYHQTPFASELWPQLLSWYGDSSAYDSLADWNVFLINKIITDLGFKRETHLSSSMNIKGVKDEMHTEIINKLGGTVYISGASGTEYRKESVFIAHDIKVIDIDFMSYMKDKPYKSSNYLPGLNILDILFNIGREGLISYFELYSQFIK